MKNVLEKGFTLIEMMIVVAIVGILTAVAVSSSRAYAARAARPDAPGVPLGRANWLGRPSPDCTPYPPPPPSPPPPPPPRASRAPWAKPGVALPNPPRPSFLTQQLPGTAHASQRFSRICSALPPARAPHTKRLLAAIPATACAPR